ncbi:MAG: MarR family transcriptional regulator [Gammaproteobacteria bacterium]|nr:MAG: MarR family transcriptional regulator [Gammaproteobacteria bacterium]
MPPVSIGDALFTKTQQRVLGLLYGRPGQGFYVNEIMRMAGMGRGTVRRELDRLVSAGLLVTSRQGNQLYFQANASSPVFHELVGIVRKTFGVADVLRQALSPLDGQIQLAFIYGSVAKGHDTAASDIDVLVVSDDLSYSALMAALEPVGQALGRPVNPSLYTSQQLQERWASEQSFLTRLMDQPKLWIKGDDHAVSIIGKPGKNRNTENGTA